MVAVLAWSCSQGRSDAPRPSARAAVGAPSEMDAGLRYGPADMKYKPCIRRVGDTLVGRDCMAEILVYGPYADVPARSKVTLGFDVQGPGMLGVYSDMTARVGTKVLGSLTPLRVPRGEKRHVEYSVQVEQPETAVEARIWLHGRGPVDFDITNLSVSVR
jgi:hypothetical protein